MPIFISYVNLLISVFFTLFIANKLEIELVGFFFNAFVTQQYVGYILTVGIGTSLIAEYGKKNKKRSSYALVHYYKHLNLIIAIFLLVSVITLIFFSYVWLSYIILLLLGFMRLFYEDLLLAKAGVFYSAFPTFFENLSRISFLLFINIESEIEIIYMLIVSSIVGLIVNNFILFKNRIVLYKLEFFIGKKDIYFYRNSISYFFTHFLLLSQMKIGLIISPFFFGTTFTGIYALLLNFVEMPLKLTTVLSRFLLKVSVKNESFKKIF